MAERSDFCGSKPEQRSHICEPMAQHLDYQCASCGCPTDNPALVCKPTQIR
jgi:hypothetical protein